MRIVVPPDSSALRMETLPDKEQYLYQTKMTRSLDLYLFRHGYTCYNKEKRYQGRTDLALLPEEWERIRPFPLELGEDSFVYVSPALRSRQTAELLFPGTEQVVIPEFREMDFGVFEGRSADEMAEDPQYRQWVDSLCTASVPGGESLEEFENRVADRFERLVQKALGEGRSRLLIIAHGGTQMAVMDRFSQEKRPYWSWQTKPGEAVYGRIIAD